VVRQTPTRRHLQDRFGPNQTKTSNYLWPIDAPILTPFVRRFPATHRAVFSYLKVKEIRGRTEFLNELISYAGHLGVRWTRFDFKGAPPLEEFFEAALLDLGDDILRETKAARLRTPLIELVNDLKRVTTPVLFLFDTFEKASEETRSWLETKFLPVFVACQAWLSWSAVGAFPTGNSILGSRSPNSGPWSRSKMLKIGGSFWTACTTTALSFIRSKRSQTRLKGGREPEAAS
jgi:hypothetical protein